MTDSILGRRRSSWMLRFSLAEEGSFSLMVACPLHAMQGQGAVELDHSNEPLVRQVTLSLHGALSQLTSAIERNELDRLVDELKSSPTPLVSSNLCEAFSAMHEERVDNSLDVAIDWSLLRTVTARAATRTIRSGTTSPASKRCGENCGLWYSIKSKRSSAQSSASRGRWAQMGGVPATWCCRRRGGPREGNAFR